MIELYQGSIFNTKCDLLIVPCDNMGGISTSVWNGIKTNDVPLLYRTMYVGEVVFIQNNGKFPNASMIGYAASVDARTRTSSESILRNILHSIKQCCYQQSFQKINIPLLGTGAGKLTPKTSLEVMKTELDSDPNLLLCVYVLSQNMYSELTSVQNIAHKKHLKNPRVFISYTGIDKDNRKWVKDFACRLRKSGVNARLDMFHLKPGQDLPQWMTNELIMADKVLLICDTHYAQKADNRNGGVGWETMIIQGDMLARPEESKYIAILRDSNIDQSLPIYVKSKYALNWSESEVSDKDFNELLLNLFDCDIEPPIGEIPDFIKEKFAQ